MTAEYTFNKVLDDACRQLIDRALSEDFGGDDEVRGDITSTAIIPASLHGRAVIVARQDGVLAGIQAAELVFRRVDPRLHVELLCKDGSAVHCGQHLAQVAGTMRSILAAERTTLNFVQHLSGIATLTRRYVDAVAGLRSAILDTRKTIPGERLLAKYAVLCGGGQNHRFDLSDGVLIKDNHLAALRDEAQPIAAAIAKARAGVPPDTPIEIEVDTLEQFDEALAARADIILLDNLGWAQMREAVRRRNDRAPAVLLEASGGVNLQTVRAIAETGVDRISVGGADALGAGAGYRPGLRSGPLKDLAPRCSGIRQNSV